MRRQGFVLLAVLWILVAGEAIALALTLACRRATLAALNRSAIDRASWQAEGCAQRTRAVIGSVLQPRTVSDEPSAFSWSTLDSAVMIAFDGDSADCSIALEPTGTTIDVNTADRATLERLFIGLGLTAAAADSDARAILYWRAPRDSGDTSDMVGEWYRAHGRAEPRHGPFAAIREVARLRGLESLAGIDSVLGVDGSRILVARAPLVVLSALPGFGAEAVARVATYRATTGQVPNLATINSALSPPSHDSLDAHYAQLAAMTTDVPDAWILISRGGAQLPPVRVILEIELRRDGTRAAVVRRRTWLE